MGIFLKEICQILLFLFNFATDKQHLMSVSLYQYSQLFSIVETLVLGITLLLIGNSKLASTVLLKRVKLALAVAMLIVGTVTAAQYAFEMSNKLQSVDIALNISTLFAVSYILITPLIPLADAAHMTRKRVFTSFVMFITCTSLVWIAIPLEETLANILRLVSLTVYFLELVRVIITLFFYYNRQRASQQLVIPNENGTWKGKVDILVKCIILLSVFAIIYIFTVMMSSQAKAIFNFAMLAIWGYLFVAMVNMIINYTPEVQTDLNIITSKPQTATASAPHTELSAKVNQWIENRSYCQHGITMIKVAEQFSTNRTYLSRYINNHYGCNFNTWLTRLRIEEAKRLLLSSPTLSIDMVANRVGFSSKSHFMTAFKSQEHITPGQWRDEHFE